MPIMITAAPHAMFPYKGIFVGKPGNHRNFPINRQLKILLPLGVLVAGGVTTAIVLPTESGPTRLVARQARLAQPVGAAMQRYPIPERIDRDGERTSLPPPASGDGRPAVRHLTTKVRPLSKRVRPIPKKHTRPAGAKRTVLARGSCGASYYWEPQPTASGEHYDPEAFTAAHKSLPFGSKVRVTNKRNGKSVVVRINDRGPYVGGRCLDLSRASMKKIGGISSGVAPVSYELLSRG